jgi:hypothetical protein
MGDVEKVIACFKELKFVPCIDDFQHRLIVQKINCLLNFGGINTGFECNLYLKGPYSPDLAKALYTQTEKFTKHDTTVSLNEREKNTVVELNSIFGLNPSYLEIGSTYAFLTIKYGMSPSDAIISIKRTKSFFTDSQIAIAVSKSKEFLARPSKELIDLVTKEGEMWDTASTPLNTQEN